MKGLLLLHVVSAFFSVNWSVKKSHGSWVDEKKT